MNDLTEALLRSENIRMTEELDEMRDALRDARRALTGAEETLVEMSAEVADLRDANYALRTQVAELLQDFG